MSRTFRAPRDTVAVETAAASVDGSEAAPASTPFEQACLAIMGLCALGTAAMGVYGWLEVPAGASVAIHFDMTGTPNGWRAAPGAFATIPLVGLLPPLLTWGMPKLRPSIPALERSFVAGVNAAIAPVLVFGQWSIVAYAVRMVGAG